MNCHLHDYQAVICSRCKHRAWFFSMKDEDHLGDFQASGFQTTCEMCTGQLAVTQRMTAFCECIKCIRKKELDIEMGRRVNAPLLCRC